MLWSDKLLHPVCVRSGSVLETMMDAANYILRLPIGKQNQSSWKAAKACMLDKDADPQQITEAVEHALMLDGVLEVRSSMTSEGKQAKLSGRVTINNNSTNTRSD
jgi:hypothetical protein